MRSTVLVGLVLGLVATGTAAGAFESAGTASARDALLTFVADDSICVIGSGAVRARRLTYSRYLEVAPSWSPDGSVLAYGRVPAFLGGLQTEPQLALRTAGGRVRALPRVKGVASWSPTGAQLAVAGFGGPQFSTAVELVTADGVRIRTVAEDASEPAWAPDGSVIAFTGGYRHKVGKSLGIGLVRPDGTSLRWLTRGDDSSPSWSPDGKRLAFTREGELYVVERDGTGLIQLTTGTDPAWSPDGTEIAYAWKGDIWAVASDGSERRQVTSGPRVDGAPDWRRPGRRQSAATMAERGCGRKFVGDEVDDRVLGSPGDDLVYGLDGEDAFRGGAGRDVLDGGGGDDWIHSRDRERDEVTCGPGNDRVLADRRDAVFRDCERVSRG